MKQLTFRAAWLFVLLAVMLAGCDPFAGLSTATPTPADAGAAASGPAAEAIPTARAGKRLAVTQNPQPLALSASCLLGVWQAADLSQALGATLARVGAGLALQRVDGQALYEFDEGGGMKLDFNHFVASLAGQVDGREVTATQSLDGSGSARYAVDAAMGQVRLSHFGGDGIQFTLDINGQRLAEGSLPVWSMFATGQAAEPPMQEVSASTWSAACGSDTLTLRPAGSAQGSEIQLSRLR